MGLQVQKSVLTFSLVIRYNRVAVDSSGVINRSESRLWAVSTAFVSQRLGNSQRLP